MGGDDSEPDFLLPGGALRGPLMAGLLERAGAEQPRPGDRIGPFRLLREIGRGGMGTVFVAERADGGFAQRVALKCMSGNRHGAALREHFTRERELLAGLDHPAIVRLIDGGCTAEGMLWFAMEYVDGSRLDVHVRERRLDLRARVALMLPLCDAVAAAHRRLVVHRDIKPSNAMVSLDGQVKLLDFGIAAPIAGASDAAAAMTPAWASPEQRRREPVTTASDIYQLGLVLVYLAQSDSAPPRGSTALSGTRADAVNVPASASPAEVADPDLRAIAQRACAAAQESRYASAAALADDLRAWLARRPVMARGGGIAYRAGRLAVRRPWAVAAAVGAMAALVMLGAGLAQQRAAAQREAAAAREEAARSRAAVDFLGELFGAAQPGVHRGKVPTLEDALAAGAQRLRDPATMPASLRGELLARLGAIRIERSEFGQAVSLLEEAVPLLRGAGAMPDVLGEALGNLGYSLDYAQAPRALDLIDEGVRLLQDRGGSTESILRLRRLRASILVGTGRFPEAQPALDALIADAVYALGEAHAETAMVRVLHAMSLNALGRSDAALVAAERGWRDLRTAVGGAHPRTIQAGNAFASSLYNLRRFDEQLQVLDQLLADGEPLWGAAHPRIALLMTWKGAALFALGRHAQCVEVLERAASIYDAADPADDLGSPNTLAVLGDAYAALGRDDEALAVYRRMSAREIERRTALPPDDGSRALRPARLLVRLRRADPAHAALDEAASRARAAQPSRQDIIDEVVALRGELARR